MDEETTILSIKQKWYDNPISSHDLYNELFGGGYPNRINLGYYYLILARKNLLELRHIGISDVEGNLFKYKESILVRYQYSLFLQEQIKSVSTTDLGNDMTFLISCFAYNQIVLIYSLVDSLGWFLNYYYDLGYDDSDSTSRMRVTLVRSQRSRFLNSLRSVDEELYDYIVSDEVQNWLKYIKKFRDMVQHRGLVRIFPYSAPSEGIDEVHIEIDPELQPILYDRETDGPFVSYSVNESPIIDIYAVTSEEINSFLSKHMDFLTTLLNTSFLFIKNFKNSESD